MNTQTIKYLSLTLTLYILSTACATDTDVYKHIVEASGNDANPNSGRCFQNNGIAQDLKAVPCDPLKDEQLWIYDAKYERIQSKIGGCIHTKDIRRSALIVEKCEDVLNQRFTFETNAQIKAANGMCINSHDHDGNMELVDGKVEVFECLNEMYYMKSGVNQCELGQNCNENDVQEARTYSDSPSFGSEPNGLLYFIMAIGIFIMFTVVPFYGIYILSKKIFKN
eukprot:UN09333